jgi:hypothetical protein
MFDIVAKAEEFGNADFFGTIFGTVSMAAIRAYLTQGERMYDSLVNLGDTTGRVQQKSATMANTLKANLQNLQTAFLSFADKNLTGPLEELATLLNNLAEDPDKIEAAMRRIAKGVALVAGVKLSAGVVSFIANLKSLKGGAAPDLSGLANAGGGAGMPVYVTNWGGGAGLPGMQAPGGGSVDQYGNPLSSAKNPSASKPLQNGITDKILNYLPAAAAAGLIIAGDQMHEIYSAKSAKGIARKMVLEDTMSRQMYEGYDPSAYIAANPEALTMEKALEIVQENSSKLNADITDVNDLIITPRGQFNTHPDDYILAMKNPAALVNAGIAAAGNHYQNIQGAPGLIQNNTNTANTRTVNDMILTPQGQFSTHPDDYILAMKNPAALVNPETPFPHEMLNEIRSVERIPQAASPVVVEGEIELRSELVIDDKGYRLRQSAGKNTTPYKFAVGSAKNARLIQ